MEIKAQTKYERIAIGTDDFEDGRGEIVVMLYVPDIKEQEHEHIEFDRKAAIQLRDFLNKYIDQ